MFRRRSYINLVGNDRTHDCKTASRGSEAEILAMLGTAFARGLNKLILAGRFPAAEVDGLLDLVREQMLEGVREESEAENNDQ